ncbi:hypothetical protein CN202_00810 [Sinorhizobium meliloti]|nr:hypothetical protein CN202_00810 [Sinorhizobium meliloti]
MSLIRPARLTLRPCWAKSSEIFGPRARCSFARFLHQAQRSRLRSLHRWNAEAWDEVELSYAMRTKREMRATTAGGSRIV